MRLVHNAWYQVIYRDDDGVKHELTGQYLGVDYVLRHAFSLRPLAGTVWIEERQFITAGQSEKEEPELPRKVV